jgi:hypothetical protein
VVKRPHSGVSALLVGPFPGRRPPSIHWREPTIYATILQTGDPMSEPTKEELMAKIAELEKKVEGRKKGTLEFRVGEKGGVSVYGLGRFPVTLYYEQWVRLLDMAKDLRDFLEENKHRLKLKDQ